MCLDTRLTKMSVALAALFGAQAVHSSDSTDSAVPTTNAGKPRRFQFVGKAGQADPGSSVSDSELGEPAGGNGSIGASNSMNLEKPPTGSANGAQKVISVEAREEPPTKPNPDQTGHIQYISPPLSSYQLHEIEMAKYLREKAVRHFKPQPAVSTRSKNGQKKRATAPVQERKPGLPIPQRDLAKERWLERIMQERNKISMTKKKNKGLVHIFNIYDEKHGPRRMIFRGWSPMIVKKNKEVGTLHFTVWNAATPDIFHEVFAVEKLKHKKRPKADVFNIVYCNGFVEEVTGYTGKGTYATGEELDTFFKKYKPEDGHKLENVNTDIITWAEP